MKLDTRDLELLSCLAEDGSLTTAAKRMHLSQPAASQRLARLQASIGSNLFERRNGLMRPTVVGERLVAAARNVTTQLDAAFADITRILQGGAKHLRVTTQCHTCYRWLPYVMREMSAAFPGLCIDIVPEATEAPVEAIIDNRVDIAIVSKIDEHAGLALHDLFEDELFAIMRKDHVLARRSFLNPPDFRDQTLIVYNGTRHAIHDEILHPAGVVPARTLQLRMTEAIIELARSGQGIAVQSGWAFSDLGNNDGLAAVRITRGGFRRQWQAAVSPACNGEQATAFIASVREAGRRMQKADWRMRLDKAETKRNSARPA
ncbi:MAG: LysR family transcriptional regulator [Woeseiaceae bacterium]|nr:LysR family transcriptional regulator [Woeseiaceae bacterium]